MAERVYYTLFPLPVRHDRDRATFIGRIFAVGVSLAHLSAILLTLSERHADQLSFDPGTPMPSEPRPSALTGSMSLS